MTENRNLLEIVAQYLLKREIMDKEEFEKVMTGKITLEDVAKMEEAVTLKKASTNSKK